MAAAGRIIGDSVLRFGASLLGALWLSACATVADVPQQPPSESGVIVAQPDDSPKPAPPATKPPAPAPAPPVDKPAPIADIPVFESPLKTLPRWSTTDVRPALISFRRSCSLWANVEGADPLNPNLPDYGNFGDWTDACQLAMMVGDSEGDARAFFENQFTPVPLRAASDSAGLMTGYYQPEIEVRRIPTPEFSEPILAVPTDAAMAKLPRAKLGPQSSRVIAYGRAMEVFFMQIQGSGHMRFEDGRIIRAAYAGNNGFGYTSIGGVLIRRGEVTRDKSSKRDIEAWMAKAGPKAARALINENKRYIFFKEEKIEVGAGPRGAMRVPLTGMGSVAVDPRYHPYGALFWIEGKFPQDAGDYRGRDQSVLLSAQDTGKAIVGPMRGDVYFGSGDRAGALAGVMKHKARWTMFLPRALAARLAKERTEPVS